MELKFPVTKEIIVDIDAVAEGLEYYVEDVLMERCGICSEDLNAVDFKQVRKAVAKKWLAEA